MSNESLKKMWFAVSHGRVETLEAALAEGADPNAVLDGDGETALMMAANCSCDERTAVLMAKALLGAGAIANTQRPNGTEALSFAVERGNSLLAKVLIRAGGSANARAVTGDFVLMRSARLGDIESVRVLLDASADAGAHYNGETAVFKVASRDEGEGMEADILELLLAAGGTSDEAPVIREPNGAFVKYPLTRAAMVGSKLVSALLDSGRGRPWEASALNEALGGAVLAGQKEVVELLLRSGADVNSKVEATGNSVIGEAAWRGRKEVAELLLSNGADVNRGSDEGITPLMLAVLNGFESPGNGPAGTGNGCLTVMELLIGQGADVNARASDRCSVLHFGAKTGNPKVVSRLLSAGANVFAVGPFEDLPINMAGDSKEVRAMLQAAMDDKALSQSVKSSKSMGVGSKAGL